MLCVVASMALLNVQSTCALELDLLYGPSRDSLYVMVNISEPAKQPRTVDMVSRLITGHLGRCSDLPSSA